MAGAMVWPTTDQNGLDVLEYRCPICGYVSAQFWAGGGWDRVVQIERLAMDHNIENHPDEVNVGARPRRETW